MYLANRDNFDLWDRMFTNPTWAEKQNKDTTADLMKTDIIDTEAGYEMDIDLPGYEKENIQAELSEGYLTITAVRTDVGKKKDEKERYLRKERYTGSVKRSFYIGEDVKKEQIKAAYKSGVLKLLIPKQRLEDKKPKFIEIE